MKEPASYSLLEFWSTGAHTKKLSPPHQTGFGKRWTATAVAPTTGCVKAKQIRKDNGFHKTQRPLMAGLNHPGLGQGKFVHRKGLW